MTTSSLPAVHRLLPSEQPLRLIDQDGLAVACDDVIPPDDATLMALHRSLLLGRRFDTQATALTKQGRLAVYPSSRGQDACQVGSVAALAAGDWLFPTYRDSVALVSRGLDPAQVLVLLRGDWHCGYDPIATRTAPQCTPLATNTLHAVGLAHAAALRGDPVAVLVLLGDGATSEGDTHEALNFAAVYNAPVVFLVQNNGFAISVPFAKQSKAPSLAHKAIGYGMRGQLIDGNDVAVVYAVVREALDRARVGDGPTLIEALTYRIEAHTNADDATRYREQAEVETWLQRDPIDRLTTYLRGRGLIDDDSVAAVVAEGETQSAMLRAVMNADVDGDPLELFEHLLASKTAALREQRRLLADELAEGGA
jgi:2-oxoisovalerate dehydrogenase E1 component alpha subunit